VPCHPNSFGFPTKLVHALVSHLHAKCPVHLIAFDFFFFFFFFFFLFVFFFYLPY
jgi:hypothetical protein